MPANSDSSANERALPPAEMHPFFKPLSAKRANTGVCGGGSSGYVSEAAGVDAELKRQKPKASNRATEKRGRKPKPASSKPTATLQSFFVMKSSRSGADALLPPDSSEVEPIAHVDDAVSNAAIECVEASVDVAFHMPPLPRPKIRMTGIPAPYPTEHPHVPAPVFTPFVLAGHAADALEHLRFSRRLQATTGSAEFELNAQGHGNAMLGDEGAQWRELVGEMFQLQQEQRLRALSLDGASGVANTLLRVSLGRALPQAPHHLPFAGPLLDILCGRKPHDQTGHSQLLVSRYRPQRASDVLDNRCVVAQLQSWIEGMRLKRTTTPVAGKCSGDIVSAATIDARAQDGCPRIGSKGRRHLADPARRNRRSTQRPASATSDCDSDSARFLDDSDDDFIPAKPNRRRRAKDADGLGDVLAWAQSDGTLTSVREKTHSRYSHRRRNSESGSGGEVESFSNIILLEGPSGSCKTAAVYACASECGFDVHEIHPGQRRSGKDVLAVLEDVIQSHTIAIPTGSAPEADRSKVNQMLILIEHIDVLFEQDQRLWPVLKQLALKSRRPIVLTCNDTACIRWDPACFYSVLQFQRPSEHVLVPYCFLLCLAEGALVPPTDLARVCTEFKCDVNRILNQLEFTLRVPNDAERSDISPLPVPDGASAPIDIGGTLEWLTRPFDREETLQTRYDLWISLVASAQASSDNNWYSRWPDSPPPTLPPAKLDLATGQNRFFGQGNRADPAPSGVVLDVDHDQDCLVTRDLMPLALDRFFDSSLSPKVTTKDDDVNTVPLEDMADALDTLSLVCALRGGADLDNECLREPLHTFLSPMSDSCLEIDYIVLDPNVITRCNPSRLPDNLGAELQTGAGIDTYLESAASQRIHALPGYDAACGTLALGLLPQRGGQPMGPSILEVDCNVTLANVRDAMSFVGIVSQQSTPGGVVDTVAYLSTMVRWDWIHQGKLQAPSSAGTASGAAGDEHTYRVGVRRTRQRTYRAHVKFMPPSMQQFLISWNAFK